MSIFKKRVSFSLQIEKQVKAGPKSEIIKHSPKILKTIQEMIAKTSFSPTPVVAEFQRYVIDQL